MTDPIDTAWKIHAALVDWTGKVDTKASFALTIEAALLAGVVTLSGDKRVFSNLSGWAVVWYVLGIALLIAAVLCAAWVVRPRLRGANLKAESVNNFVYFGHLRHLLPEAVQERIESEELLPVLSKQLVDMSKIAWMKHRLVQISMSLAPVGVLALGICATY
ncbi:Pycsar system effector family protein [Mycolicibacterium vinylchloridicum]|uniref:Pycsar system effector family protein n=1 Tax=Mycolicibacterium vinylchloridicum TaxID=2736928 RepID=UPI002D7EEEF9|nr:Pycsar system effector family protein [Mycolicibacterium vinylchloridicum]